MNIGKGILGIMVKAALLGSLTVGTAAAATATANLAVVNNTPPDVARARMVRHHNPASMLDIRVALPLRNGAALAQFLHDVQDRTSPSFHHFLTADEFRDNYGPTKEQVQTVVTFLESKGIKVTGISANNTRIHATARTAVLESAFGVAINDYSLNGRTFYSASSDPLVPEQYKPLVIAVLGLDNAVIYQPHSMPAKTLPKFAAVFGGPSGFTPQQIATGYNWPDITSLATGAGVTLAIATAYNFRVQDLNKFWSTMGTPAHNMTNGNPVTVVPVDGISTTVLNGETTLDIQRSGAMAPGAAIKVYECVNPANINFDDEFNEIAADNSVQVVSTSWGSPENENSLADIGAEHQAFVQMATAGKVMIAAAGDNGSSDGEGTPDHADFPASDPYVVSAGGTVITNVDMFGAFTEAAWTGAGGADSAIFAEPNYQNPLTTADDGFTHNTSCPKDLTTAPGATTDFLATTVDLCAATAAPSRQNSDISMDGGTGYAIYFNGRWEVFIGTSFVAPQLAGLFSDLVQQNGGVSVGPGNALLYCAAADGNEFTDYFDITTGNSSTPTGFDAGPSWDHPTGWGTPNANILLADIQAHCLPP